MKRLLLLLIISISSVSFGQFNCADTTLVHLDYSISGVIINITSPISFTDSGGENGNYSNSEDYEIIFNSGSSTNTIVVNINETDFEHGSFSAYDILKIYTSTDGVNWILYQDPIFFGPDYSIVPDNIGNGILPFTLDLGTQYVKFTFYSDASITEPGWKIILTPQNSSTSPGSETMIECNSYTWNTNGQTYTQSGQYTEVLTNQSGCDSTVTLNLTIEIVDITSQPVDQTVVVGNNGQFTVTTSATNPSYQWQMDDGTGFVNLSNAGQYSGTDTDVLTISNVQFGQNNFLYRCIVTSGSCETISTAGRLTIQDNVGLDDINKNIFNVYPNPTSNSFTISSEKVINSEFTIIDSQGREMLTGSMNGQEHTIDISKLSKGVYSVVFDNTEYPMVRVIKE